MLPIDYEDLSAEEVKSLIEWFALPAYQTLRTVILAQQAKVTESAMTAIVEGHAKELYKSQVLEVQRMQFALDLLAAAAQGYYEDDKSNEFEYQRLKPKLE